MIGTKIEKSPLEKIYVKDPNRGTQGGYRSTPIEPTLPQSTPKLSPEGPEDPDDNPPLPPAVAGALAIPEIPEEERKPLDVYSRKRVA